MQEQVEAEPLEALAEKVMDVLMQSSLGESMDVLCCVMGFALANCEPPIPPEEVEGIIRQLPDTIRTNYVKNLLRPDKKPDLKGFN